MSIHRSIKARREALGWSLGRLAMEVSVIEGRADRPLAWQTVQQWEREGEGGTAPKRTRLASVATALQTTVEELMAGTSEPLAAEFSDEERALVAKIRAIKALNAAVYEKAVDSIYALAESLQTTDSFLRGEHGITGYVTPARAEETLGGHRDNVTHFQPSGEGGLLGGMSGFGELEDEADRRDEARRK